MDEAEATGKRLNCSYCEIEVVNHRTDLLPYYKKRGFSGMKQNVVSLGNSDRNVDMSIHPAPSDRCYSSVPIELSGTIAIVLCCSA